MNTAVGFVTGLIFGLGLAVSGMADPHVVLGFLDIAGDWNPALLFVMVAGVAVAFVGYRLTRLLGKPVVSGRLPGQPGTNIDARLVGGSALFGIGWGLAGYCPGPGITSLVSGHMGVFVFVIAMLVGMSATRFVLFHVPHAAT